MDKKVKTILYIVLFAGFLAAALTAYNYLSSIYQAKNPALTDPTIENTGENGTENPTGNGPEGSPGKEEEKLKAADFTAYDYDGNKVFLSDYIGTPIVLNFWASWCPPCRGEMPHFNKVSEEYSKDELIFLMVDLVDGKRETVESGKKFVEENQYTFTVLFDSDQDAAVTYGVRSIPCTLFIDREGYIEDGYVGSIDEATLRNGIDLILNKK